MLHEKVHKERKIKVKQETPRVKKEKKVENVNKQFREERKQGIRSARNISSQQELNVLVECLQKLNQQTPGIIKLDEDIQENGKKRILKLFYSNISMRQNFHRFRDFIYIHRRVNETRFNKFLTLVLGIDNDGYNKIFALALTSKEDVPSSEWVFKQFNEYMGDAKAKTIVIERNKNLHKSLTSLYNGQETSIVYCPYYIHKSLKFEFDGDLRSNNEALYDKIVSIPLVESQTAFEGQLAEVKNYALMTNNDRHRNLILKLESEKTLWAVCYQKHLFMGGVVICDRVAKIKGYLKIFFGKFSKPTVSEALTRLLEIEKVDLKGHLESRTISFKHNQVFMNFKFIREITTQNLVKEYVKERVKWFASKSFKFEISNSDEENKVYQVSKKKELGGGNTKVFGEDTKVVVIGNELFCSCLDQFTTGIPCAHEFCVHMKHPNLKIRLNKRWYRGYSESDFTPEKVDGYLKKQKNLRSCVIQHMKDSKSSIKITDADFSFKSANLCPIPIKDMSKIVQEADNALLIPIKQEIDEDSKDLNEEELKNLLKEIDPDNIDLEELEKLIEVEEEDPSIGDDPNEKYNLGNEFNRKVSAKKHKRQEEKKKREELREKLKEERSKKREAKFSRKKRSKEEDEEEEEEQKTEEKKIVKRSINDIMQAMNTSSKLNFTRLLLESRKKDEEDKKIKEEEKTSKKKSKRSKQSDESGDDGDENSGTKKSKSSRSKSPSKKSKNEEDSSKSKKKTKKGDESDSSY